jgi:uncharacterized protein (DUF1697 family)
MPRHFAFLRAINVGGHTVRMDALRGHFTTLGLADVETFIASGNVIFSSRATSSAALVRRIEVALHEALGYEVATFLRTDAELAAIAQRRPFPAERIRTAGAFVVGFLADAPGAADRRKILALATDIDELHVHGREVYWLCRTRQSDSDFSGAVFERALGVRATFRGMNTVTRLAAAYDLLPGR